MRSNARVSGAKLGVLWLVSFALFVGLFTYSFCGMLWIFTMVYTPFYVGLLTDAYSQTLPEKNISYLHAYGHSFLTVFHASLILALGQWVYFQYLDHGMVINSYTSFLTDKENMKMMEAMGYTKKMVHQMIDMIQSLRPIDLSLQMLWTNIMAGFFISLTTALYVSFRHH
jgi:hypothetical protein